MYEDDTMKHDDKSPHTSLHGDHQAPSEQSKKGLKLRRETILHLAFRTGLRAGPSSTLSDTIKG
jgi:hypothetical protein